MRNLVKNMNKEGIGTLLAFGTAIISGFSIFANKFFVIGLDPTVFTALRAIIIGLLFLSLSLIFNSWKDKENSKVRWGYLIFIGIVGGGIAFLLFFSGLKLTTGGRASFIHKTLPLYATLLAFIFLKEKISRKQWIALGVMLIGLVVLVSNTIVPSDLWMNPAIGDLMVLGATVLWAVENVVARKAMIKGESNFVVSFARMFFGAVFLFGVLLFMNNLGALANLTGTQWSYILASTALLFGYVLTYYWSIRYINVSKASTILLLSPVITLVLGATFLAEPVGTMHLIGGALILIGGYFISGIKSEMSRI